MENKVRTHKTRRFCLLTVGITLPLVLLGFAGMFLPLQFPFAALPFFCLLGVFLLIPIHHLNTLVKEYLPLKAWWMIPLHRLLLLPPFLLILLHTRSLSTDSFHSFSIFWAISWIASLNLADALMVLRKLSSME